MSNLLKKEDLEKENLTGRYLKVVNSSYRNNLKYLKIANSNAAISGISKTVTYKTVEFSHEWMDIVYRCNEQKEFILMPIGFNPENFNPNKKHYEIYY